MGNKHIWINRYCDRSVSLLVLEVHGTDPDTPDLGHAGSFPALAGGGNTRHLCELVHQSPAHVTAVWLKLSALCLSTVCHALGMFQYEKRSPAFLIFVCICWIHSHNLCISCLPPDVPVCVHKIEHSSKRTLQIHSCINYIYVLLERTHQPMCKTQAGNFEITEGGGKSHLFWFMFFLINILAVSVIKEDVI